MSNEVKEDFADHIFYKVSYLAFPKSGYSPDNYGGIISFAKVDNSGLARFRCLSKTEDYKIYVDVKEGEKIWYKYHYDEEFKLNNGKGAWVIDEVHIRSFADLPSDFGL